MSHADFYKTLVLGVASQANEFAEKMFTVLEEEKESE